MKIKRFHESISCRIAFALILLFVFAPTHEVNAQSPPGGGGSGPGGANCGVIQKLGGLAFGNSGEVYYDRFGNAWAESEIMDLNNNVLEECDAGVFKLSFSGTYSAEERLQVCAAMTSLSGTVGGTAPIGVVPLKIEFISNVNGGGAAASQFMQAECGLLKNFALVNIRTKANQLPIGFFAGLIQIDTDPD